MEIGKEHYLYFNIIIVELSDWPAITGCIVTYYPTNVCNMLEKDKFAVYVYPLIKTAVTQ